MKNLLVLIIVLFSTSTALSQKENINWEIGLRQNRYDSLSTVMTFDTPDGEPIIIKKGIMPSFNAFSSISSPEGKLLLSSNGTYAYSYAGNPQLLSTKDGISKLKSGPGTYARWGDWGTNWDNDDFKRYWDTASGVPQASLILKQPGQNNNYYIFTTDKPYPIKKNDVEIIPPSRGLNYSVVDLNLNGGNGQYSSINTRLDKFATIGQMTAVRHANNKDIWILAVEDSSLNVFAYLLTENGIENNAVISTVNGISASWSVGVMKANIFGDMIAITRSNPNNISQEYHGDLEICKFDNLTGELESLLTLQMPYSTPFGLEFSPDGKLLYVTGRDCTGLGDWSFVFLIQMDISILDENYIKKNTIELSQGYVGYLQLAPNGKIYVGSDSLRVINKPNLKGYLCDFTVTTLDSSHYWWWCWAWSLPSILIDQHDFQINPVQSTFCEGQSLILTAKPWPDYKGNQYVWTAPDGKQYNGKTVIIPDAEMSDEGLYKITMEFNSNIIYDSVYIKVLESPKAVIKSDGIFCYGETFLSAETKAGYRYLWSTGDTTESIDIKKPGSYQLIVTNENLCSDTVSIEISSQADLALEIASDKTHLCFVDSTKIYAKAKYHEYLWSTGETTESITVRDAGVYHLIVKNEFGCSDSAEIEISKFDANVTFDKEKLMFDELCLGDSKIDKLQLKVETNSDFVVNRIHTTSNNFSVTNSNSLLKSYQNGDTAELEIKFEPLDAGEFFDTLFVESEEPCIYRVALPIYGSSKALFRFALPVIETEVGRRIEIPVNSALICPNANKLIADYEIEISVDKAYFLPQSVQFGEIIKNEIVGNVRILKIQASAEFEKLSGDLKPINIIYGQALIGRSDTVPLTIQNVGFTNERYYPEYQNGSLKIDGCVNDLSGIQIFKPTTLQVAPNPADGDLKVTVGTQEEGNFSIIIYDFQGREVAKSEFSRNNRIYEEKDYTFNISGLGTGVYSVHLTAPWTLKREQLVIVK